MKKIYLVTILLIALFITSCGQNNSSNNEASINDNKTNIEITTNQPTEPVLKEQPVELDAAFDEEFTISMEENLYIGRPGISIKLNYLNTDEYGVSFGYTLVVDGEEYWGSGFDGLYVDYPSVTQEKYTPNRIKYISSDEGKNVTLLLTSDTVVADPLVLSGNPEDEYITTKPEYVETDDFILFLDEGIKVYGNTTELIKTIFDLVEKETGLKLENDTVYSTYRHSGPAWLFGQDTFAGVDPELDKFHIYVVDHEKCVACAPTYCIVINPQDLDIAAGEGSTIVHEMVHSVHIANGIQLDRTMDEGYATYMTGRIADKDEVLTFNFDSAMNYSGYSKELTKENAEAEFNVIAADDWEEYQYGYRFLTFLFEEYGEDIFINIMKDATTNAPEFAGQMDTAEVATYVKKNTSETVFEEFAEWYALNRDRFEPF